jgi:hypothetical protein
MERPSCPKADRISSVALTVTSSDVVEVAPETARATCARSEASTQVSTQSTLGTSGTDDQRANDPGKGVRGKTNGSATIAYIRRRISEIVARAAMSGRRKTIRRLCKVTSIWHSAVQRSHYAKYGENSPEAPRSQEAGAADPARRSRGCGAIFGRGHAAGDAP